MRTTTLLYEDPQHPERVTGTIESPDWTADDRALMLGLEAYEATLCPGPCGQPIDIAWHTDMDGWWSGTGYHCFACSAIKGEPVGYHSADHQRDFTEKPLPLFELGITTDQPVTDDA